MVKLCNFIQKSRGFFIVTVSFSEKEKNLFSAAEFTGGVKPDRVVRMNVDPVYLSAFRKGSNRKISKALERRKIDLHRSCAVMVKLQQSLVDQSFAVFKRRAVGHGGQIDRFAAEGMEHIDLVDHLVFHLTAVYRVAVCGQDNKRDVLPACLSDSVEVVAGSR